MPQILIQVNEGIAIGHIDGRGPLEQSHEV